LYTSFFIAFANDWVCEITLKLYCYKFNWSYSKVELISFTILFSNFLFLLAMFPYVSVVSTPFDTQPYCLMVAVFLFLGLLSKPILRFPRPLGLLLVVFLYAGCLYPLCSDYWYGLRSLAGYASTFFIALASYKSFKYVKLKIFYFAIIAWLFFGLAQLVFGENIGMSILPRMTTNANRGVTSLAVEPSYYAIVCVFFLILNEIFYHDLRFSHTKNRYIIIMAVLCLQMLISFSGMGLYLISVFALSKALSFVFSNAKGRLKAAFAIVLLYCCVIFSFFHIPYLQNVRGHELLAKIISHPTEFLYIDSSVADRTSHICLSGYSLIYSRGLGLGLGTWNNNATALAACAGGWIRDLSEIRLLLHGRIMSGWGSVFYELGLCGSLYIGAFFCTMFRGIRQNAKMLPVFVTSMISLFFTMLMSVPLAFPLWGYVFGALLYYAYAKNTKKVI